MHRPLTPSDTVAAAPVAAIRVELDGTVCLLTIDRPEARNAISRDVIREMDEALDEIERLEPRALILRGAGERAFVAGGDVKDFDSIRDLETAMEMSASMRTVLNRVAALPVPTVAALNGAALGGGMELAVACDFRIAVDDAVLGFNQVLLGITPAWGGIERLTQLVGPGRASWLLFTGRRLTAAEAREMALVEIVVPRERFDAEVAALVDAFNAAPQGALTAIKAEMASVRPRVSSEASESAVRRFAECWIADAHWDAVDAMRKDRA